MKNWFLIKLLSKSNGESTVISPSCPGVNRHSDVKECKTECTSKNKKENYTTF